MHQGMACVTRRGVRVGGSGLALGLMVLAACGGDDSDPAPNGDAGGGAGASAGAGSGVVYTFAPDAFGALSAGDSGSTGAAGTRPASGAGSGAAGQAGSFGSAAGGSAIGGTGGGSTIGDSCGPAATVNADGVLTAFPHITYSISPAGWSLESVNFVVTEDGDPRGPLLEMFGELVNDTGTTECSFLPNVLLEFDEVITLVEGPAYFGEVVMSVTTDCLGPGETGVLTGVARGITTADLAAATSLTIMVEPNTFDTYFPAAGGPTVTMAEVSSVTAGGFGLRGKLLIGETIYNYGMRVYPRDARGVLVDELLAFPNELDTLGSGSTVDFETDGVDCNFDDYLLFQSWIVGAM
jgi:hypothetical protein